MLSETHNVQSQMKGLEKPFSGETGLILCSPPEIFFLLFSLINIL